MMRRLQLEDFLFKAGKENPIKYLYLFYDRWLILKRTLFGEAYSGYGWVNFDQNFYSWKGDSNIKNH